MAGYIKDRTVGIGGSDIGPILGLSIYRGPLHVYLEKRKELPDEKKEDNVEGKQFGQLCEPIAARMYAERTGRKVWKPGRTYRHPQYKFMMGNLDRLTIDVARPIAQQRGVMEIKWLDASRRSVWVNEGVPEGYYLQIQHYMLVTGLTWGSFAVVFGGNKFEYFDVPRDEAMIYRLLELEVEFWRRVETGNPPDLTFDEMGLKLLKRLYPKEKSGAEMILDDDESKAKTRRLFALTATIKKREEDLLALEVWFKEKMGEAEKCLVPGIAQFTWKAQTANRIDAKRLRAEQPELAAKYTNQTESRVFRKTLLEDLVPDAELVADEMITTAPQAARRITFDE